MSVESLLKTLALKCKSIICTDLSIVFEVGNILHEAMYARGHVYQEYILSDMTLNDYIALCKSQQCQISKNCLGGT